MKTIKEFKSDNWDDKLICDFLIGRSKLNLEERVFLSEYLFRLEKLVKNNVALADVSHTLFCGNCDGEHKHIEFDNGDLKCYNCGYVAKL